MQERMLLVVALVAAMAGILILAVLPERPYDEVSLYLAWSNGTAGRGYACPALWVEWESEQDVRSQRCYLVRGHRSGSTLSSAGLLPGAQEGFRHCP